jgi:hypothetical protein
MEWAYQHPDELHSVTDRGRRVYEKYSWEMERSRFTGTVNRLLAREEPRSSGLLRTAPFTVDGKKSEG